MKPYFENDLITLYLGNCLEITEWLKADVLITDPPYGMNRVLGRSSTARRVINDETVETRDQALELWGPERGAIMFGNWRKPRPAGVTHLAIWNRDNQAMGDASSPFATSHEDIYLMGTKPNWTGKRSQTVLTYKVPLGNIRPEHPTPKPVPLMEYLINLTSGTIAEPFAGSGATLVAAQNLNRKAIGVEIDEAYCEIIANRLSQQTFNFGGI